MELIVWAVGIGQQDDIADQIIQTFLNLVVLLLGLGFGEVSFDLALSSELRPQFVMAVGFLFKKSVSHRLDICVAENLGQHRVSDERFGITRGIERNAALCELAEVNGYGWNKVAEDAFDRIDGDAPDTEKAQDMVDAESVK